LLETIPLFGVLFDCNEAVQAQIFYEQVRTYMVTSLLLSAFIAASAPVSDLQRDETLLFYPAVVSCHPAKECRISVSGRVFEQETDDLLRNLFIKKLITEMKLSLADQRSKIFKTRVRDFLTDNEGGKKIRINMGGSLYFLGESGPDDNFSKRLSLPKYFCPKVSSKSAVRRYRALLNKEDPRRITGTIYCIPEKGISVISDIDDTIKISHVLDKEKMLSAAFLEPFRAVPLMARRYRGWQRRGAVFHYVSGSPWQLYSTLRRFMKKRNFPPGEFKLKSFRIKDRSFFSFIMGDQRAYKMEAISSIIKRFPKRRYVLVGDSGESDTEVFAEISARFPRRVKAVYIRDAGNLKERKKALMNIFRGLSGVRFRFFTTGRQLPVKV